MKNLIHRLSIQPAVFKLRLALGFCYLGEWARLLSLKFHRASKRLMDSAVPPDPEEEKRETERCVAEYHARPIERYSLELIAWRGDDGDNQAGFVVGGGEAEKIMAVVGDDEPEEGFPLESLTAGLGMRRAS